MSVVHGAVAAVVGFILLLLVTVSLDLMRKELQGQVEQLPHRILRLATRRLPRALRAGYFEEWQAELDYILNRHEARPITRLLLGFRFATGLFRGAKQIHADHMGADTPKSPDKPKNSAEAAVEDHGGTYSTSEVSESQREDRDDTAVPLREIFPTRWRTIWENRSMLLRVARRRSATVEDAEDAVQEAMLRAAQHTEIPDDRLQPWLIAVTTRLCIDGHRRRAEEARWAGAGAQPVVEEFGQHPEEARDRSEAAWVASKADELLPPRQAEALRLAAAGCDVQQIAREMGLNYRAAESLLTRARQRLRES